MKTFTYTITSFDATTNILNVQFSDGGFAHIQLRTPLPTNKAELENIIKTYTASLEDVEACTSNVDLTYISALVDVPQDCERFSHRANHLSSAASIEKEQELLASPARAVLANLNLVSDAQ